MPVREHTARSTPNGAVTGDMKKNNPMKHEPIRLVQRARLSAAIAAALAGGSLLGTCEMRLRDAVVDTSKSLLCTTIGVGILGSDETSIVSSICR